MYSKNSEDDKLCFKVMPFGPVNAPGFYSCMMGDFKKEWDSLFLSSVRRSYKYYCMRDTDSMRSPVGIIIYQQYL